MNHTVEANNNYDNKSVKLEYEDENTCPICKAKIYPVFISASLNTNKTASVFNYCRSCRESFITQYEVTRSITNNSSSFTFARATKLLFSEPNRFVKASFDKRLEELSPKFVSIYNQALAAECSGLDEIAGLGYRKALEFLVKDYAIHTHPSDEEKIKLMRLSPCIKQYIDNNRIVELAEKSAWIGNDEAHYIRKQDDLDVSNMKDFLQALVYFVSMDLVAEEASNVISHSDH